MFKADCWKCQNSMKEAQDKCPVCQALQPCRALNAFERFAIPATFEVDLQEIEKIYFERQRLYHPDRFATGSKQERIYSSQHSAALNEAYQTLNDPILRARLLLKIAHYEKANIEQESLQDPKLLMEVMTLREELLEADSPDKLNQLAGQIDQLKRGCVKDIAVAFKAQDYDCAAQLLNRLSYFSKLYQEIKLKKAG